MSNFIADISEEDAPNMDKFTCIQIDEICFIDCNYFYVMSCDIIKRITLS